MTTDQAAALTLLDSLPKRHLTERLLAGDPELAELARPVLDRAVRLRAEADGRGIRFAAWNDPAFPAALLAIPDCPPGLWYRGDLAVLSAPVIAIVGSRRGSPAALHTARQIGDELAGHGVVIASGLARGVDSAAHEGALQRGRTAAVLGSGHDQLYPPEHAGLAARIAESGVVLSEYPPDSAALPFRFPLRNRLISGLSRAVVVIEAAEDSGSLITAACALEQGREVMVVPGTVAGGRNRGGHALIRDGARIVECAGDVLAELGWMPEPEDGRPASPGGDNGSGDVLLRAMDAGRAYDLDELAVLAGVQPPQLLPRLSSLELDGRVRRAGGGRFIRTS